MGGGRKCEISGGDYCVMVCTHRPQFGDPCMENLRSIGAMARRVDGIDVPSCAALWNRAIIACPTEIVVICNEKARPTREHLDRTRQLLGQGHGLVALYRFGFFGFRKDLVRCIGWFDEQFIGGWHEDNDYINRMCEADVSYWEEESVPYLQSKSAWRHDEARAHWEEKWALIDDGFVRLLGEEEHPAHDAAIRSQGLWTVGPGEFLPWSSGRHLEHSAASIRILR